MGISKDKQIEEMDRNAKAEERLSESIARDDDVGFKDGPPVLKKLFQEQPSYDNDELVEVIEEWQSKINQEDV